METAIFIKILLIVIALISIAFLAMGITMLIKKNGKFPELHIGKNENMKEKGITCVTSTEKRERQEYKAIKIKKRE